MKILTNSILKANKLVHYVMALPFYDKRNWNKIMRVDGNFYDVV